MALLKLFCVEFSQYSKINNNLSGNVNNFNLRSEELHVVQ